MPDTPHSEPRPKLKKLSPKMTAEVLQTYGARLDEKPSGDAAPPEGSPEPTTLREWLMYGLLKIRGKNGRLRKLVLNRAQQ